MGTADFGRRKCPKRGVEGVPVRTNPRGGPRRFFFSARHEDADRVLAAIRREEEIAFVRDEYARDALQPVDGLKETIGRGVNDVDIIVRRVGDVEPRRSVMNRSVIETAILCMRGKLYGAQ